MPLASACMFALPLPLVSRACVCVINEEMLDSLASKVLFIKTRGDKPSNEHGTRKISQGIFLCEESIVFRVAGTDALSWRRTRPVRSRWPRQTPRHASCLPAFVSCSAMLLCSFAPTYCFHCLLAGWLAAGGLAGWLVGWLTGWVAGRVAGWLAGWHAG